jgi:hypothetical protein
MNSSFSFIHSINLFNNFFDISSSIKKLKTIDETCWFLLIFFKLNIFLKIMMFSMMSSWNRFRRYVTTSFVIEKSRFTSTSKTRIESMFLIICVKTRNRDCSLRHVSSMLSKNCSHDFVKYVKISFSFRDLLVFCDRVIINLVVIRMLSNDWVKFDVDLTLSSYCEDCKFL